MQQKFQRMSIFDILSTGKEETLAALLANAASGNLSTVFHTPEAWESWLKTEIPLPVEMARNIAPFRRELTKIRGIQ